MTDFTKLNIWVRSKKLAVEIYKTTSKFPPEEKFGIINQMRRCSTSIPTNIAEGCGRNSKKDFSHFLSISMGSLNELYTFIELSEELNFINKSSKSELILEINELKKMIYSYKTKLLKKP